MLLDSQASAAHIPLTLRRLGDIDHRIVRNDLLHHDTSRRCEYWPTTWLGSFQTERHVAVSLIGAQPKRRAVLSGQDFLAEPLGILV